MNIKETKLKIHRAKKEGSHRLNLNAFSNKEKLFSADLQTLEGSIKDIKNLTSLILSGNNITDLSSLLELTNLTSLALSGNKIQDLAPLSQLTNLTSLNLWDNEISDLAPLSNLKKLTSLVLSKNHINDLQPLSELTNLTNLFIRSNQISDLSPLSPLKNLQELDLSENRISDLTPLSQLESLNGLDLSVNRISDLIPLAELDLTNLLLYGNLLVGIPLEILSDDKHPKKILNYYIKIAKNKARPLNEAKIVVVGEADFGKTLLIRRLIHNDYVETQSTQGIKIERWENVRVNNENVCLNVWDFGGQEIMHSTHQFFFTKRTIYVLVIDARQNEDKNKAEEWLKRIESFGGDSPVIVVGSHVDHNQRDPSESGQGYFQIDRRDLQAKYNIKGFYEVCSDVRKSGYDDLFKKFNDGLVHEISKLKGIHEPFPADWFSIKEQLETMKEQQISFISDHDYLNSCFEKEIKDKTSQDTIREFLNEIGTIIYFKDLPEKVIFNPEWITNAVYSIVDNPVIIQNKGELEFSHLTEILYRKGYKSDEHRFILELMRKFELCVDIESNKRFLIPDLLLNVEEPSDTGEWISTLGFQYHYETYLRSIFTMFLVRMYVYILRRRWWRNGMILGHEESEALVKFDSPNKKVTINIRGNNIKKRQNLLAIIRKEFKEIHSRFAVLNLEEKIAHPKFPEILKDYDELISMEEDGETEVYVKALRRKLPLSDWLDGVETKEKRHRHNNSIKNNETLSQENTFLIEENPLLKQLQISVYELKEKKTGFDVIKTQLDERSDVWATIIRWMIGSFLLIGLTYSIYWCVRNEPWIEQNWTKLEVGLAITGIVIPVLVVVFFLFKKKKISEETTISWIEENTQRLIYWKNRFYLTEYLRICEEIEKKEGRIKMLTR